MAKTEKSDENARSKQAHWRAVKKACQALGINRVEKRQKIANLMYSITVVHENIGDLAKRAKTPRSPGTLEEIKKSIIQLQTNYRGLLRRLYVEIGDKESIAEFQVRYNKAYQHYR